MPEPGPGFKSMLDFKPRSMSTSTTIPAPITREWSLIARWPALAALSFGMILLYFVVFSPIARVHNSAHDTRHANGFPCL
jgi:cobalt transporter subunit CbtB